MQPFTIDPAHLSNRDNLVGSIICEEVSLNGHGVFHKGHTIEASDLERLKSLERSIHAAWLDADDVHEDAAGKRLATSISAGRLPLSEPRQSRVNVLSDVKGLLRIDGERLNAINLLPGVLVFSLVDRMSVLPGKILAGAKIASVAIDRETLSKAEAIAAGGPILQVKPFKSLRVGVISTERLEGRIRERFQSTLIKKIAWFGGGVMEFKEIENEPARVAESIEAFIAAGADLILTGGGDTIDPLDAALLALDRVNATIVKFGAPVHPGSMFWLAYRGTTPIFNLASCSMYSRATSADLVLPWIMAGERVTTSDIADLGFGGLLEGRAMSFRFPPYDTEQATPEDD
jgi:hypothetical protein